MSATTLRAAASYADQRHLRGPRPPYVMACACGRGLTFRDMCRPRPMRRAPMGANARIERIVCSDCAVTP